MKPTDLDLHCLLRQDISCLAREGLNAERLKLLFSTKAVFQSILKHIDFFLTVYG